MHKLPTISRYCNMFFIRWIHYILVSTGSNTMHIMLILGQFISSTGYLFSTGVCVAIVCAAGSYHSPELGCTRCISGSISTTASSQCTFCLPGTRSNENSTSCLDCESGYYSLGHVAYCTYCGGAVCDPKTGRNIAWSVCFPSITGLH